MAGIISEHEAAPKKDYLDTKAEEQPSDEENKLAKQIDNLFSKAAQYRKKYDKCWVDNYRMFRGDQWIQKRPTYKHREVVNLIFQTIQSQVSVMLDTRPTVSFLPMEPSDMEFADILNKVFEADWMANNWLDEVTAVVYDAHVYSVGYSEACYDKDYGTYGGIKFRCADPFDFYPDPEATQINKECCYLIRAKPMDLDKVKLKYAGHKYVEMIKADLDNLDYEKRKTHTLHRKKNTDLDIDPDKLTYATSADEYAKDKVLVLEAYLHPSETEQIEKDDMAQEGEKIYITRKKYPRGRKVVKINGYIFEDKPLEYDHLEFPYQKLVNYILPREFFGMSEIDQTKGPQMVFNKLINFALDVLTLTGNPVWLNPIEGNVDSRKLTSQPGLIVDYANGNPPQRVEGANLQPYVLEMIDRFEKYFNDTAGTQDVTRGVNPTGVTANAAIENLLETAQKRIKQKMRSLDSYLKDFGRQYASLVMQYYDAPRVFRLTSKEGANTYFKFHVETRPTGEMDALGQPRTKKVAVVRQYIKDDAGRAIPSPAAKEYELRSKLDVVANTVSGLPFSKAQNETQILNLFDRQIIDQEEVLKRLEYPNYQAVLQRTKQQQMEAAQQGQPSVSGG